MTLAEALVVFGGGLVAGFINSIAGAGSLITVPLLAEVGVIGTLANGTNRIGVLSQSVVSAFKFARSGRLDFAALRTVLWPALVGAGLGAYAATLLSHQRFERLFGYLMIPLLIVTILKPKPKAQTQTMRHCDETEPIKPASSDQVSVVGVKPMRIERVWTARIVFASLGFYAGAVQAGMGLISLVVLSRYGFDLIEGNAIKNALVMAITLLALPIFLLAGDVVWLPGILMAIGAAIGGYAGARSAIRRGERIVKLALIVAVVGLSGRMLGLW